MDCFKKAKAVRFRSHHNKYLLAGDDEESVWQGRSGTVRNARWTVEINENGNTIRLKSCYGKYLTASNVQGCLGMKSKKVLQTLPETLDSTVEWEPIREGFKLRLKMAGHSQFLRANGGAPPWRNSVTHDTTNKGGAKDWVLWDVDAVEIRADQLMAPPAKEMEEAVAAAPSDDGVDKNDGGDSQQPDTPSTVVDASAAKHNADSRKTKICHGVNDIYSCFTMCTCPLVNKASKSS